MDTKEESLTTGTEAGIEAFSAIQAVNAAQDA